MPLIDRIERALDQGVDADEFERAASALLEDRYTWLSAIEAGTDFGRDADIYGPVQGDPDSRGRLLATTGDVLSNLKRSHKSWKKAQSLDEFRVDALVIATSNPVTATKRRAVERYCRDNSLPLPHFYARRWLVNALLKNSHWREKLTHVRGRLDAIVPASMYEQEDTPLLGRDDLLANIQASLAVSRDVVLDGVPGVGKSRLLSALGPEAFFAEPLARDYLADDLIAIDPSVVAVDDAHLHSLVLQELARIRAQEGLTFSIVASTWPHETGKVAAMLPGSEGFTADPLPLDLMDAVVQSRGVSRLHARQLILSQSEGRPGWAVTLCDALISNDGARVVSGDILLDQAIRCVREVSDSELTVDAIACAAALDGLSPSDAEVVGGMQARSGVSILEAMKQVATNGLLELQGDRWNVQPALRGPILARWFFGPLRNREWQSILEKFPDRHHELVKSLLDAARMTRAKDVQQAAKEWFSSLPNTEEWDEATLSLIRSFSLIDDAAATLASKASRHILSTERAMQVTPWGTLDPMGRLAREVLEVSAQAWFNEEAVFGLLDLALTDDRPRHQATNHPIRILGELARHIDPDDGTYFEIRHSLLRIVSDWVGESSDSLKWPVCCEVLSHIFSPSVAGTWSDPSQSRSITIANGVETPDHIAELLSTLPRAQRLLQEAERPLPPAALVHLVDLLDEWLRLAGGHATGAATVTQEQRAEAKRGAWEVLRLVAPWVAEHPGVTLKLWKSLDLAGRWELSPPDDIDLPSLDDDLVLFVGRRENWDSTDDWIAHRDDEHRQIAARLLSLGPEHGTCRFVELVRYSAEANMSGEGQGVALMLASATDNPSAWIRPAVNVGAAPLVYRMVWEARHKAMRVSRDDLRAALADERTRWAAVGAVLDGEILDESATFVVNALEQRDAWSLERLFTKNEPDDILRALLNHSVADVRATAAVAFAEGVQHGPDLPLEWRDSWRSSILDADAKTVHGHSQWRLQEILKYLVKHDPELATDWFARRIEDETLSWSGSRLHDIEELLRELPRAQRSRLAHQAAQTNHRHLRILPHLIGHDPELAGELVTDGTIEAGDAVYGLTGERDFSVELLAPTLLRHGISPERIARVACSHRSYAGNESASIQQDLAWFADLERRIPALHSVCQAATRLLRHELERALSEERDESVRGWR